MEIKPTKYVVGQTVWGAMYVHSPTPCECSFCKKTNNPIELRKTGEIATESFVIDAIKIILAVSNEGDTLQFNYYAHRGQKGLVNIENWPMEQWLFLTEQEAIDHINKNFPTQ